MLPEFWNAIDQWKALFGDVFHHEATLSAIFNNSVAPTVRDSDKSPSATAPKRVARLITWNETSLCLFRLFLLLMQQ